MMMHNKILDNCSAHKGRRVFEAVNSLTTKAPSTTTKKPTATTKTPTTLKPSGKTVVFPKLKSPIANYKFTKVFGVMAIAHKSVAEAKFQHLASILAEWLDNDEDGCVDTPAALFFEK